MLRHFTKLVVFAIAAGINAHAQKPTEYQVKAAYLYNFGKFVKWPPEAQTSTSFPICVLGEDPFGKTLTAIVSGEKLEGKTISTRRIDYASDAVGCRIVFVGKSEQGDLSRVLAELAKHSVLTVSEIPKFADRGGAIGFVMEGDRVRFQVNTAGAQRSGLTLSSELLKVATSVKKVLAKGDAR
ncbi:MAG TPA: YfiR family protein [Terriglobales bacterium]|nr:YfiR family protein [Terriglobales bacterium]